MSDEHRGHYGSREVTVGGPIYTDGGGLGQELPNFIVNTHWTFMVGKISCNKNEKEDEERLTVTEGRVLLDRDPF